MILNFVRFIGTILVFLFSIHYFLYFSTCRFLNVEDIKIKQVLFLIFLFLSLTFVVSSILIHIFNSPVTRVYYLISGLWTGLMSFLAIVFVIIWIIKAGLWVLPVELPEKNIIKGLALLFFGAAVIYTGYCHYRFYKIKMKFIDIPVQNLPVKWQGKKIIHLSDLHLGGAKDITFLKKVIALTNEQAADLIVITGDLFDGATSSHERYTSKLKTFKAGHGVMFTSGNHEVYSGIDQSRQIIEKSGITLLDNKAVVIDGLQILGISYPEFDNNMGFDFNDPEKFTKDLPTILLYHTPTRIKSKDQDIAGSGHTDYLAPDIAFANTIRHNISLQLSGHTHAGQFFPFTMLADKIFKGFHYGLHQIGDFHIYISSGTGSWGPPLRSGYLSEIAVITLTRPE